MESFRAAGFVLSCAVLLAVAAETQAAGASPVACLAQGQACMQTAHVARRACREDCRQNATPDQANACWRQCGQTFRTARTACAGEHRSCMGMLAAVPTDGNDCLFTCGVTLQTCVQAVGGDLRNCVSTCAAAADHASCLQACVAAAQREAATCATNFQTCTAACVGTPPPTFTPPTGCACGSPCADANGAEGKCVPLPEGALIGGCVCVVAPPPTGTPCEVGQCFETIGFRCTGQPCGPNQPCNELNEFCDLNGDRCPCVSGATPTPTPTPTPQCTDATCGGGCVLSFPCPQNVPCEGMQGSDAWLVKGQCQLTATGGCECQPLPTPTAGPPTPTPTAPCSGMTCEGPCLISIPCAPGGPCPEVRSLLGQCESTTAGDCECVAVGLTPLPTPTPQCMGTTCGGPCFLPFPCPLGMLCAGFQIPGECGLTDTGSCECLPPPTPTPGPPTPTPTPQCMGGSCGGPCVISFPCPPGVMCEGLQESGVPAQLGECQLTATGGCECLPFPTPTPGPATPTPTPQCASAMCGGPCVISFSPFPCPFGKLCNGPDVPPALSGQCELTAAGTCDCVPITPTPLPTPTPQCDAVPCGGSCVIFPPCAPNTVCPDWVLQGECQIDSAGACQCVPVQLPTPTPACATDADCDDGNACTADHCIGAMCNHECICLTATGEQTCCAGGSALCVEPCGLDAAGTCSGVCPSGAKCEALPTAEGACGCVSGVGGPCGGNVFAPEPVCAAGLVCSQILGDVAGVCEVPNCIPLFASGCSQTSDCCEPCLDGRIAPCGVCISGVCVGAP
jgi:hypothetical protein